jgi:hypothetical protein
VVGGTEHEKPCDYLDRADHDVAMGRKIVAWLLAVDRENREYIATEQRETRAG